MRLGPKCSFQRLFELKIPQNQALWWIFSWVLAALLVGNPVHYKAMVSTLQGREGQKTEKQGFQVGPYFIVVGFINRVLKACSKLSLTFLRTTKLRQSCPASLKVTFLHTWALNLLWDGQAGQSKACTVCHKLYLSCSPFKTSSWNYAWFTSAVNQYNFPLKSEMKIKQRHLNSRWFHVAKNKIKVLIIKVEDEERGTTIPFLIYPSFFSREGNFCHHSYIFALGNIYRACRRRK